MMWRTLLSTVVLAGLCAARAAPVEIHPAGPTIPENLLRFELRFARPQPLPFDIRRIRLVDGNGQEVQHALLDLALPSSDGRRIAILMDPGRVKSGAGPNRDAGRAIKVGARISLQVDEASVGGLHADRTWQVTAAVLHPIVPSAWKLSTPRVGSRDALTVDLREPISSSGEGLMVILGAAGRPVRGKTALAEGDTVWRFIPDKPWEPGVHTFVTHPDLEDAAGNRSCAAFEQLNASKVSCNAGARIGFEPSPVRRRS